MSNDTSQERAEFERALDYTFHSETLLINALTHKSFANEHHDVNEDNQRLEFLGDAVIGLVVAEALMTALPDAPEGELTPRRASLVNEANLARLAESIDLGIYLRLGRGEEKNDGRQLPSILADAMESVVGAIYLDGGYVAARRVVTRLFGDGLTAAVTGRLPGDPKTDLQERMQGENRPAPHYRVVGEEGPDHEKIFEVEILCGGEVLGRAKGRNKKEAEKAAAGVALDRLEQS